MKSSHPLIMSHPNELVEVVRNLFLQKKEITWPYTLPLGTILKVMEKQDGRVLVTDGSQLFWIEEKLSKALFVAPCEKSELNGCRQGGCSQCRQHCG